MGRHQKFSLAPIVSLLALITPLPLNAFPHKLAANVPNNFERSPTSCSFGSFLIVSQIPFINNPDSS